MQWVPYLKQCKSQLSLPDLERKKVNTQSIIIMFILATFWERAQFTKFKAQFGNMLTAHASTAADGDFNKLFLFDVVENLLNEKDAAIGYNIAKLGFVFITQLGFRSPALVADIHRHYIRMEYIIHVNGLERSYQDLFNYLKENRSKIGDPYGWILCTCDILTQAGLSSLFFDQKVGIADYLLELSKENEIDNIFAARLPPNNISGLLLLSRTAIILVRTAIQTCKTPFLVHYLSAIHQHSKLEDASRIFIFNTSYLDSWKNLSKMYTAAFCKKCPEKNCNHCASFANHIISFLWCPDEFKIGVVLRAMRESSDLCDVMELQKQSKSFQHDSRLGKKIFETINRMKSSVVRHEVNLAAQDYWDVPFLLQYIFDKIALAILPANSTIDSTVILTTYFALTKRKGELKKEVVIKNIVDLIMVSKAMKILVNLFSTAPTPDFTLPPCSTIIHAVKSLQELKDKQLSSNVKEHIQFSNTNFQRLQNLLKNVRKSLSTYSFDTLQALSKYEKNIISLMRCCNIKGALSIKSMMEDVKNLFSEYSKRKRLVDWLVKHNCDEIEPIDEIENESYDELDTAIEEFNNQDIFEEDIDVDNLLVLTEEDSIVFMYQLKETRNVIVAYKNTIDFFKNVIRKLGDANYNDVIRHRNILSAIHQNIENETQIIRKIVDGDDASNLAANITETLQKITECFEISEILTSINQTGFCDRDSIKRAGNLFTGDYSMVKALEEVKKVIGSLTSSELIYFPELYKHREILELEYFEWGEEQFVQRCNIARNNLGSSAHRYALAVLQNLETARKILTPIINYKDQPPRDLSTICKELKAVLLEDDSLTIDAKLESFKYVSEKRFDLALWFDHSGGGLAGFGEFLTNYAKSGQFVSRLPLHPKGVDLTFIYDVDGEKQTYLNLEENIIAARVFNQTGESNSMGELYDLASEIHETRRELETTGHPSFQGTEVCLNEIGKLSKKHYKSLRKKLEIEKQSWLQALSETSEACPNLLFLNSSQLSRFISKFLEYLKKPNNESFALIHPYLWYCFPFDGYVDAKTFSAPALQWAQEKTKPNLDYKSVELLKLIGELINTLAETAYLPEDEAGHRLQIVILQNIEHPKSRKTFTDVNSVILKDVEGMVPHPSQYFYCDSPQASIANLSRFLECSRKFSFIPCYLIKVESLTLELREHLIGWLAGVSDSVDELVNLTLVFYDISGAERYSFIDHVAVQNQTHENSKILLSLKMDANNPNGVSIACYCSPSETGKSYEINKRLDKFDKNQIISLNIWEDFTPKRFLLELAPKKHMDELAIYLDISAFSNFVEISKFLESLICWGLVCDGNSGEIVYCGDIKKHLFIELHTAPEADKDFSFASNIDNILLELYCIPILAKIYKKEIDCQIEITKDLENIAVWFQLFSRNNNTGLKNATVGFRDFINSKTEIINKLDPEFVYQQYTALKNYVDAEYQIQLPLKKRFQNFFIKIFAARINWLQRNIIDIFVADPALVLDFEQTFIDTVFKTLLIESVSIAKDNLAEEMDHILKNRPFATVLQVESSDYPAIESAILTTDAGNLYHKYPKPPGFFKRESAGFVSIIASGLGITQSKAKVKEIIKLRKYVFTRDFVFKLLFVHDRMKARENVLFEGDTGVGKTELLSIYSYLVNYTSNFDGCHSLREIITKRIYIMEGLDETTEKTQIYSYTKKDILEEIDRLLKPEGNFNIVVPALLGEISQVLQKYPLVDIRSKGLLSKAISCINDGGDWNTIIKNNDDVKEIIENICEFEYISLFYPIRMHDAYSVIDLHNDITKITSKAIEIAEKTNGKATVVVFVDELNTTSIMGPMQSIFCDRMYEGKPLPDNILWVCAINPHIDPNLKENKRKVARQNKITNFTGVEKQLLDYFVRPIPTSLKSLSINFAGQTIEQERQFVRSLLIERYTEHNHTITDRCSALTLTILASQQFIKSLDVLKITVSIRDILRTVKIYEFLMNHPFLLNINENTNENEIHWKALILTLGMSYMCRLQTIRDREDYVNCIQNEMKNVFGEKKNHKKRANLIPGSLSGADKFINTLVDVQGYLFDQANIPDSIGKTEVFCENFFSVVVCCCAVVPLIIIGPPGCSKTLSFSVAIDNLSYKSDQRELFRKLPKLEPFRYQCTAQSTDREIIERYKSAKERQNQFSEKLNSKDNDSSSKSLCVVFLDEAGLSKEIPMKAIHYELDHPVVSTVILTNNLMDAAIMNRALQVFQRSTMSANDLKKLTSGTLGNMDNKLKSMLTNAFVASYVMTLKEEEFRDSSRKDYSLFQLRDYILFLRFLREHEGSSINSAILLNALERNFNGIDKDVFRHLVQFWFKKVNDALRRANKQELPMPKENDFKSNIELLRENLDYRLLPKKDPNTAAYRFILVIDPTDNETAVSLLYSTKLCKPERENIKILENSIQQIPTDIFDVNKYSDTFEVIEVRAVKAFKSQGRIRELSFPEGTTIRVRNSNVHLEGWWEGEIDGIFGLFPSNHTVITKYHGTLPNIKNCIQESNKFYEKLKNGKINPPASVATEIVEEHCKKYYKANETIQISIGDFSRDKSLDTLSEAVHKVVYAMKEGKTVILINSSIIDGCFYDLFNRYFKVIQSATGRDCYANVAIGTHSRETIVHPDFKVIVHVPKSKLSSIALPYINRFEMYQLSVRDILEDKKKLTQWKTYKIGDAAISQNIIELVYNGCLHFIREVQASSQDKLLFGIAPEETLSSILLDVIDNTDKSSSFPNVKRPFITEDSFNENMKNFAKFQLYENNATIHGRIKNIIRNINFRILQLARPEYLYNTDILKHQPAYIHEYFMKQEHFSVLRLMRSVIKYHIQKTINLKDSGKPDDDDNNDDDKEDLDNADEFGENIEEEPTFENQVLTPKKWCIFTRSCGELQHLQKSFISFIYDRVISKENKSANDFQMEQFALEDLPSIADIKEKVSKILSQETKILLITVDMEECTSFQVNNLRQNIDIYIKEDQLVFTILHFPPLSMLTSKSGYHAIFINDWEFCYIDGIGVSSATSSSNKNNNNNNNNSANVDQNTDMTYAEEVDGRAWIARAFGLKIVYPEPGIFRNLFFEELSTIINTMVCGAKNPTQCPAYKAVSKGRTKAVLELFKSNEGSFIVDYFLNIFKDSWTKKFLIRVVTNACKEVTRANIIGSLISSVRNKLLTLLRSLLEDFIKIFYSQHQLVHLYDMKENYQDIYKYAITLIPNRDADLILSNFSNKPGFEIIVSCADIPTISRVPMFHSLNKFLLTHLDSIDQQRIPSLKTIYKRYFNHLSKHKGVMKLLEIIECFFMDDYLIDLLDNNYHDLSTTINNEHEQLHLIQAREMLKDLLITLSRNLTNELDEIQQKKPIILAVYICLRTIPQMIIYYKNFFVPLLQPFSTKKINNFTIMDDCFEINWESKVSLAFDLEFAALKCTINGYWDLFTKFTNANELPLQDNLILSWCKSFRVLHYRTENTQNNLSKLYIASRKEDIRLLAFRYKIFFIIFSCIRDLGIDPELMFEYVRKNSTIYEYMFIDSPDKIPASQSELYSCMFILERILSIDQVKINENIQRSYARILSSICNSIFRGRDRNLEVNLLENSLKTLISLGNFTIDLPKIREIWYENMTFDWTLNYLNNWIHPNSVESKNYSQDIFNHLARLISNKFNINNKDKNNQKQYTFSYCLLYFPNDNNNNQQIIDINEQLYYFLQTGQYKHLDFNTLCKLYEENKSEDVIEREDPVTYVMIMCAIVTCILQQTIKLDSIKKLENNKNKKVLQEILTEGENSCKYAPKSVVLYFLQQFPQSDVLHILCDKKYYKDILKLDDKWGQLQPLEDINENYFPFMYENKTDTGKQYQTLKDLIMKQPADINAVLTYISNHSKDKKKYSIRCFLILIAYYEFFNFNVKADIIEQIVTNNQMKQCLSLTDKEIIAYKFVCNPNPNQTFDMFKPREFDANNRKQKHDLNDANFHINILATTLGSIPNRCHFYPIIFDLGEALNGKKMIGSTFNHEFYDCGYQLGGTGDLQKYPAIMNDNMRYRYLLNSFVWAPVTLHSLLFPLTYVADCKAVYHFMNYIVDENYNNRSDFEKYQSYSNTRAVTFLRLFEDNETGIQLKQNGKIFAVNTLNIYVQDQWKDHLDAALVDIFQNIAPTVAYEQYLLRVFTQIEREYNDIKKVYQPPTAENSSIIKHIISIQDAQSSICVNPLPTIQQYKNFRTNLQLAALEAKNKKHNDNDDDDDDDDDNKPFIDILTNHSDALDSLELLPFFIRCYQIFSNALWKKIRKNDYYKPFLEVIYNLFLKNRITQKSYENICKLYEEFTPKFNRLKKILDTAYIGCLEIEIPKVDRDTLIATILSTEKLTADGIILILKALYDHQDKVLLAMEDYSYINQSLTTDGLYFDITNTANLMELEPLAYQQSSKLSIINCSNQNISQWINQVCLTHRFINKETQKITYKDDKNKNIYTMINHEAITFDFERIEQECIQFISGSSFLNVDNFRKPIQSIEDITEAAQITDEITSIIHDNSNTSDQEFAHLELLDGPVAKLFWIIDKNEKLKDKKHIIEDFSFELESKTRKRLLSPITKKYTENDVISLCKSLTELIIIVVSQNKTNEKIGEAKTKNLNRAFTLLNVQYPDNVSTLCNVPCKSLIPFCKFILQEIYFKQQWLYQNENMTSEFLPDQSKFYSQLNKRFESEDIQFSNDKLPIIEDILQKLTAKKSNQWLINIESQPQSNLLGVLSNNNNCIDLRIKYSHYEDLIQLIVCPSLNVDQLQLFRQWLYALCGNINVRNQIENPYKNKLSNSLEDDSFSEYYKEKLPIKIDGRTQQNNHLHVSDVGDIQMNNDKDNNNNDDDDDEMENSRFSDTTDLAPYPEIDVDVEIEQQFTPINGISNEKNNCWLSSILQCYSNNKLMIDKCKFLVEGIEKENSFIIQFYNILTNLQNDGKPNTIRIIDLYTDISYSSNKYIEDQGKQNEISPLKYQDVREFQYSIFPAVLKSKLNQASFDLFSRFCLYRSIITICHCCKTTKTEQINTLSMLVEKPCSLADLLQNFSSGKCRNCKTYEIDQKIKIETNNVMEFTIPISFERTTENILIDLPLNYPIDVSYLFYIDSDENDIEVQGIINSAVHYVDYSEYPTEKKKDIQINQKLTGHYFASICKTTGNDREWFRADDSYVKAIDSKEINTSEVVLAYLTIKPTLSKRRIGPPQNSLVILQQHGNVGNNHDPGTLAAPNQQMNNPNVSQGAPQNSLVVLQQHGNVGNNQRSTILPPTSNARQAQQPYAPQQNQQFNQQQPNQWNQMNQNQPNQFYHLQQQYQNQQHQNQQGPPQNSLVILQQHDNVGNNHDPGTFAAPNQQMNNPNVSQGAPQNSLVVLQQHGNVGNNQRSTILPPTSNARQAQQPYAPQQNQQFNQQQPNQWNQMNQNQPNQFYHLQQQYQNQQYQNQQQRQQPNQQQPNQWNQMNQNQPNQFYHLQQQYQNQQQRQQPDQQQPNQWNQMNQNQPNQFYHLQQYQNQQYQNQQQRQQPNQQQPNQWNQMNQNQPNQFYHLQQQYQNQQQNQQFNQQQPNQWNQMNQNQPNQFYHLQQYQNQQYQNQQQRQQPNQQQPNQWNQMNQDQYQQRAHHIQNNQPNQNYGTQNK